MLTNQKPKTIRDIPTSSHLFSDSSADMYEEGIGKGIAYIKDFLAKDNFFSGKDVEELAQFNLHSQLDSDQVELDQALVEIKKRYLDHAISFHHPTYVAHLNCPVLIPSLVGEMLASAVNTAIETWDQSTNATFIEQEILDWICSELDLGENADGIFTSGGSQSNMMGVLMARDHYAFKHYGINLKEDGWFEEVSRFKIFCSEKAHFSIKKNSGILGLGFNAVIPVKVDEHMRMCPVALEQAIAEEKAKGNIPIAIVATMGTTDYGSFDPLNQIVNIAKASDMWVHMDGAYGGCFAMTETHKHYFESIDMIDSATIDFHKTFYQPLCSSVFLLKNKDLFKYVSYYADYLNPEDGRDEHRPDLIEKSLQTTRRFDALKMWFSLRVTGKKRIVSYLEQVHETIVEVASRMRGDAELELAHEPALSTIVFRFNPTGLDDEYLNQINLHVKKTLFDSGRASVASTKLNGNLYLKFTLLNPNTGVEALLHIVEMIKQEAAEYAMAEV
ncbi:pyridoxal phosphate-dependent decarboxylase family protein [Aureibacter tunicatorum]|uniref:L-2,4-diaminobutyrate decarboxylase n=1 Tax=Aureibacter tunicatorum TaxID=866807 RepID=A0AAE3XS46_9BACT|nr:pyridoxal-dependent decarboxylase [Aureibacter tunicatorum]MDR6241019.1 L-2,4-diaminobutyrate decarboxylase [Aureibacter tunicatorum]BDD03797.1 decarboxylase [Aureibacter tunicatorum]